MFEVIISQVATGRVQRGAFGTRHEAEQFVNAFEERIVCPPNPRRKPESLGNYRIEIVYREPLSPRSRPVAA